MDESRREGGFNDKTMSRAGATTAPAFPLSLYDHENASCVFVGTKTDFAGRIRVKMINFATPKRVSDRPQSGCKNLFCPLQGGGNGNALTVTNTTEDT